MKYKFFDKSCKIDRNLTKYDDLEKSLRDLDWDFSDINFVSQVHSNKVAVIDDVSKIHGRQGLPKVDGIVTNVKGLVIGVVTADCAPIIIDGGDVVAVVHAGWRGALSGVIANAVVAMKSLGALELRAWIGPMIRQVSYQVSQEFREEFLQNDLENAKFFVKDAAEGKFLFDLPAFVTFKLSEVGVEEVEDCGIDTYTDYNYNSYRRAYHQGLDDKRRNISVVMLQD